MKPVASNFTVVCLLVAALATTGHISPRAVRAGRRVEAASVSAGNWSSGTKHGCCGPRQSHVTRVPDAGSPAWQANDSAEKGGEDAAELAAFPHAVSIMDGGTSLDSLCVAGQSRSLTLRQLEVRLNV